MVFLASDLAGYMTGEIVSVSSSTPQVHAWGLVNLYGRGSCVLNPVTVVTPDMPVVLDRGEPMLTTPTTIGLTRATLLRLLAALAALALVAAACGGDDDGGGDTAVEDDGGDTADDASGDGSADDDEGGDAAR